MSECLKCKSQRVVSGRLVDNQRDATISVGFKPGTLKWYQFEWTSGMELQPEAFACLDCGLVWSSVAYPELLREMVNRQVKAK